MIGTLDWILAVLLVGLAWQALSGPDLLRCVVLYIVFGLVLALVWVQLEAPDVALAEAAIGAGITGALLMDAALRTHGPTGARNGRRLSALLCTAAGAGLVLAVLDVPRSAAGLAPSVRTAMDDAGVAHEVTAVLLNFRGYDTWLEVGVLALALVAVLVSQRAHDLSWARERAAGSEVLQWFVRLSLPAAVLAGGYLLWLGTRAPGGAFQGGALIAVGLLMLATAGRPWLDHLAGRRLAAVAVTGFAAFLVVGILPLVAGEPLLRYPRTAGGTLIVLVEAAIAVATAATLAALFAATRPRP